ncbi:(2Fe-2S)-binding protein [Streptomyces sp. NPDC021212]|uniref:(2Fe-2S)-binding protein n=1 Tax=Streptomyces sp. NPDC021212 TaxID=3365118 RepID=UPI0037ABD6A6
MRLTLTVNGEQHVLDDVRETENLLYVLRERVGLTGTKNACEEGRCGSCSVHLEGLLCCACLVPAAQADGQKVRTVEGLTDPDTPGRQHPVRRAFLEAGAVQCGFCTAGMLMATEDLLSREPNPDEAGVRSAMSGNVCRCTGYQHIVDAVLRAAEYRRDAAAGAPEPHGPHVARELR